MSETIRLLKIKKNKNRIEYVFSVSEGLKKFFTEVPFFLEYFKDGKKFLVDKIPDSILAIPFVCNILPIIWITDAILEVSELDKDFYNSLAEIKKGYKKMLPWVNLGGQLEVLNIVKNCLLKKGVKKSAVFFSGGVDSWCTLFRHLDEKPDLISIWGSDVEYTDEDSWAKMNGKLEDEAKKLGLNHIIVKSSFRKTIYEDCLTWTFEKIVHDNWWHGMQHGIAIIAHAAPCDYLEGVTRQYIAASYDDETKDAICASRPEIDGAMKFAGCRVFHDAFISRQDKICEIIEFCNKNNQTINVHVCWESKTGENCMKCEKCCRTLYGFLVLGEDKVEKYGLNWSEINLKKIRKTLKKLEFGDSVKALWGRIQKDLIKNEDLLKTKKYYRKIKWLKKRDF